MYDESYQFWIYSAFFIILVFFSLLLNSILLKFVKTLGIRNQEGTVIRWNSVAKPSLGGISFYIVFLLATASYSILFEDRNVFDDTTSLGLLGATGLAFLMGLADDAYNTKPFLKLGVQILCGVILIASGNYIQSFPNETLNYTMTIFWVVGIMNSINMLDNMDGITGLVSSFILITILLYMYITGHSTQFEYLAMLGVLASLTGFLFFNWYPSKMFMGDTGSQFLGILLAALSIKFLWNSHGIEGSIVQSRQMVLVLLTFSLPIADTTLVTINRLWKKQSPFVGGRDHSTHNLSYLGLSDSQVGFVYIGLSALCAFLAAIIIRFMEEWKHLYTMCFVGFFLLIQIIFFYISYRNKLNGKK